MDKSAQSLEASTMARKFRIARIRLSAGLAAGGVVLLASNLASAQTGNCVINGGINNGIQIQNCPVIQAAPTPTFHVVREEPIKRNADGTFTRSIVIAVDAPYVPNNMAVVAKGPTV